MADITIPANKSFPESSLQEIIDRVNALENSIITLDNVNSLLKIGGVANYVEIDADGHLALRGAATTFRDELQSLLFQAVKNPNAKIVFDYDEGLVNYTDAATLADFSIMNIQINHDWKLNSTLFPHIHWLQNANAMPNWLLQYRWLSNGNAAETDWTDLALDQNVFDASTFDFATDELVQISNSTSGITTTGKGLSDILQIKLARDTANASTKFSGADAYTGDAAAINLDIHIECDSNGSNTEYSKE